MSTCPVLPVCLSRSAFHVLLVIFFLSFLHVLSCLSCSAGLVLLVLFSLSRSACPALPDLSWIFCPCLLYMYFSAKLREQKYEHKKLGAMELESREAQAQNLRPEKEAKVQARMGFHQGAQKQRREDKKVGAKLCFFYTLSFFIT
jgi:hypothetical protein